jgi:hypothetical protein
MSQGFVNAQNITLPLPIDQGGTGQTTSVGTGALLLGSAWASYTPTITLVGGSGNTVPTFSTQSGRWCRLGNTVFVQLNFLNPSGGTQGAGSGLITIALPETVGASMSSTPIGAMGLIGTTNVFPAVPVLSVGGTTCTITYINPATNASVPLTGASYAASARYLQMQFFYEVD